MKILIVLAVLLTSASSFANTLKCYNSSGDDNHGVILVDVLNSRYCHANDGTRYVVNISGIGLALRAGDGTYFTITCIGKKEIQGKYYGVKASGGLFIGADAGVFVGKGVCVLGAIGVSFGASVSGSELEIIRD